MSKDTTTPTNKTAASRQGVSPARLHQKCGPNYAFGGYAKLRDPNGSFCMQRTAP